MTTRPMVAQPSKGAAGACIEFERALNDLSLPPSALLRDESCGAPAPHPYTLRVARGRWVERFALREACSLNEALAEARVLGYQPTHLVVVSPAGRTLEAL